MQPLQPLEVVYAAAIAFLLVVAVVLWQSHRPDSSNKSNSQHEQ